MSKNQQLSAESTLVTGLTPIQEQTAILLASGESVTDVATKLNLNRSTIYLWSQKITFKCFFNQQCQLIQDNIRNGLCGLYADALQAVRDCLKSDNEMVKLKTALYVIGKVEKIDTSKQNPEAEIKTLSRRNDPWELYNDASMRAKYKRLMKENGLA